MNSSLTVILLLNALHHTCGLLHSSNCLYIGDMRVVASNRMAPQRTQSRGGSKGGEGGQPGLLGGRRRGWVTQLQMKSSGGVLITDMEAFDRLVLNPVTNVDSIKLVFYTAPWCGPCRMSTPAVESVVEQYALTNAVEVRLGGWGGG